jgi:hypothetical protein
MKKLFNLSTISLLSLSLVIGVEVANAQNAKRNQVEISQQLYDLYKSKNLLDPQVTYIVSSPLATGVTGKMRDAASRGRELSGIPCSYVPTDNFQDPWGGAVHFDDSPPSGPFEVVLPFSVCFYDVAYQSFFINNNGNVTFEDQYTTFSSAVFPSAAIPPMIAPFWGDVDTGDDIEPIGQVRYEVYPDYAIVSWDSVGVYPGANFNQRNTFQLLITDGVSSVLPSGSNLCFLYGDMQWTTGTASQGTDGFGGLPATAGVNRGDGVNYFQLGQFDAPGIAYDGPFGVNDGVDFLDNSVFYLNTCIQPGVDYNIQPQAPNAPICDTLIVCAGTPYELNFAVTPMEPNQTVTTQLNGTTIPGFSLVSINNGSISTVSAVIDANEGDVGTYSCLFEAQDNGVPAEGSLIEIIVQIVPSNTPAVAIQQNGNYLTASGSGIFTWYLDGQEISGENSDSLFVSVPGTYYYTLDIGSSCDAISPEYVVSVTGLALSAESRLIILPNPTANQGWTIRTADFTGDFSVKLYSLDGRLLSAQENASIIPSESIANGYYLAVIECENGTFYQRLLKSN